MTNWIIIASLILVGFRFFCDILGEIHISKGEDPREVGKEFRPMRVVKRFLTIRRDTPQEEVQEEESGEDSSEEIPFPEEHPLEKEEPTPTERKSRYVRDTESETDRGMPRMWEPSSR